MIEISEEKISSAVETDSVTPKNDEPLQKTFNLFGDDIDKFVGVSRLILRDLNKNQRSFTFGKYTKDDIVKYISNPAANEKNIRDAVIFIYNSSAHFRRLIQYFTVLSDLAYVVSPSGIDTSKQSVNRTRKYYKETLNVLTKMDLKNQLQRVLTVCLREDVFYGTFRMGGDSIIIQQLPTDYCQISVVEDNVPNVTFDFMYFDSRPDCLSFYSDEFKKKYRKYKKDAVNMRWQELDSPTSWAVKCNSDILEYAVPPFVGILREIFDINDYKNLKLTRTALENYAMLVMNLEINEDGEWLLDLEVIASYAES